MDTASIKAHDLLSALRTGDRVILVHDGWPFGTVDEPVTVNPYGLPNDSLSRSDGAYGSFESTGLTVGIRGGYTTRVQVDTLAGYGRVKRDGTREVPPQAELQVVELGPASVERFGRITSLKAWAPGREPVDDTHSCGAVLRADRTCTAGCQNR